MNLLWGFVFSALFALGASQACSGDAVQNLQLEQVDNTVVASWSPNTGDCEYQVVFSSDADNQENVGVTTTDTSVTFANAVPCSVVSVLVSVTGGLPSTASLSVEMRGTTAPILREMITSCNTIQMIWEAEPFTENMCQVTHFQMFCLSDTHNFTIPQAVSDVRHRTFDILISVLQPDIYYTCNGFIFVTLAGFSPASDNIEFWSNLDSVRDLEVAETETSFHASWEAPLNSEECGVAYDVTYDNIELGSSTQEVVGLSHDFDIELIPCTDYTITVTPISFTGSKGTPVSEDITPSIRVGEVSELTIDDNGDFLELSWNAARVGTCGVSYAVQHLVDGEIYSDVMTEGTSHTFERIACASNTFSVEVISEGVIGAAVVVNIDLGLSDVTSISEVIYLRWEDDLLSWYAPPTVGLCKISYMVTVADSFGITAFTTDDTNIALDLIPCSDNIIMVNGFSGTIVGALSTIEIRASSQELLPPTHLTTIPTLVSASVSLQAQSITENLCRIETTIAECSNDAGDSFQRNIEVTDNDNRLISIFLDNLQPDTVYSCVARFQNSPNGNEFSFRTRDLSTKQLVISDIGQTDFLVSWTEDYDKQFVNGYTLIVQSNGPQHDVPDWCEINNDQFTIQVPYDQLSASFSTGLPNHLYRVNLMTSYTLGFDLSSNIVNERTLTAEPAAPVDLAAEWIYSTSGSYDVSAELSWNSPCELNGGLVGFDVVTDASFVVAGQGQSVRVYSVVDASGTSVGSVFNFTLTDVNPFFTYDVSINVAADGTGPSSSVRLEAPGACVCSEN